MAKELFLTGNERTFDKNDVIVSKTDLKGRITYCNRVFLGLAGYTEKELLGQPHSIIRHPDMPRCVFKLLWDTLAEGQEIFAYVVNRAKNGDHYWVLAHVTPDYSLDGELIGYHSNRRVPDKKIVNETITPLYRDLLEIEANAENRKIGMEQSFAKVVEILTGAGLTYEEFVASLAFAA